MKDKWVQIGEKVADILDIPLETVIDWPGIAMSGNKSLVIQNHLGIIEYDQELIRVNTKLGEIRITGSSLSLLVAYKEEIVIEGRIGGVQLVDWR